MTVRVVSLLTMVLLLAGAQASPRFRAVDVFVDTGESPLAAYQIEITSNSPEAKIVGVEGGAVGRYQQAPYYDAAALQGGKIQPAGVQGRHRRGR